MVQIEEEKVCYWDAHKKELVGNKRAKILKYLREKLIVMRPDGRFELLPLPGNHQTHIVNPELLTCTCQAYNKMGQTCSHIHAVRIFLEDVERGTRKIIMKGEENE